MKRGFLIWAVLVLLAYGAAGCEKVIDVIDDRTGGDEGPTVTGYVFQQMSGIPSDVTLNDIFGFAADDVYIVATGATNRGIIFHYDGTSWTEVGPSGVPRRMTSGWPARTTSRGKRSSHTTTVRTGRRRRSKVIRWRTTAPSGERRGTTSGWRMALADSCTGTACHGATSKSLSHSTI